LGHRETVARRMPGARLVDARLRTGASPLSFALHTVWRGTSCVLSYIAFAHVHTPCSVVLTSCRYAYTPVCLAHGVESVVLTSCRVLSFTDSGSSGSSLIHWPNGDKQLRRTILHCESTAEPEPRSSSAHAVHWSTIPAHGSPTSLPYSKPLRRQSPKRAFLSTPTFLQASGVCTRSPCPRRVSMGRTSPLRRFA
jgi:hypothetical protein